MLATGRVPGRGRARRRMNLSQFLEHWSIAENPFCGEEARHDAVFARMADAEAAFHSDFEKIVGDLSRPASSIVFGEKGSGKTAIRLQIARRVAQHNEANPGGRILLVPYDDLNSVLDRLHERIGGKTALDSFRRVRLVDHIDAILLLTVPVVCDAMLGEGTGEPGAGAKRQARGLDAVTRSRLLALQAVYDRASPQESRTRRLRRALRVGSDRRKRAWGALALMGWVAPAGVVGLFGWLGDWTVSQAWFVAIGGAAGAWGVALAKVGVLDRLASRRLARRIRRQVRVSGRADGSYARAISALPAGVRDADALPLTDSDDARYRMLGTLLEGMRACGFDGMVVVVDRVDEPTLVSGDAECMRAIVWPMLNNKFLQMERVGLKFLLPLDLRHALFKESASFFQEARLDKQNLVERLTWTGAMLYDLCEARLRACRREEAGAVSLVELFAEDVTRQDVVDALDQMHQPRDAFKFLYRCLVEHCANVTAEQGEWRVPRLVLELVRRQESERVQQLGRGIRPA
jgi:hypothetical protein